MADLEPGPVTLDPYQNIINVNWGAGDFLLGGVSGGGGDYEPHVEKSYDGKKWAENATPPSGSSSFEGSIFDAVTCLAFGSSAWVVCVGANFADGSLMRSTDGAKTWITVKTLERAFSYLAFGNGVFAGVARSEAGASAHALVSEDGGVTWNESTISSGVATSISFANGWFYAAVQKDVLPSSVTLYRSEKGVTWEPAGVPFNWDGVPEIAGYDDGDTSMDCNGIAYSKKANKYVAVGRETKGNLDYLVTSRSSDGTSWGATKRHGQGGEPLYNPDGTPIENVTSTFIFPGRGCPGIVCGAKKGQETEPDDTPDQVFVIAARQSLNQYLGTIPAEAHQIVLVSTDGLSWTQKTLKSFIPSVDAEVPTVNYSAKNGFIAAGAGKTQAGSVEINIFASDDGDSWTKKTTASWTADTQGPLLGPIMSSGVGSVAKEASPE